MLRILRVTKQFIKPDVATLLCIYNLESKGSFVKVVISCVSLLFVSVLQEIPVNDGIELLQMVLNFDTKDPLILSCVLTNVSALFPFVTYRPEFLPQVFSKVNSASFINFILAFKANYFCNCFWKCVRQANKQSFIHLSNIYLVLIVDQAPR